MDGYLAELSAQLGISTWLLIVILIWTAVWKLYGMWKSARKGHIAWFIIIAFLNTVGIIPILYIYVFADRLKSLKKENTKKKAIKKKSSKKKTSKKKVSKKKK